MPKQLYIFLLLITLSFCLKAQDSVVYRTIFIGDAGEMDIQQRAVLNNAAAQIIRNKTTVIYLGDNIYPKGMGLPGSKEEATSQEIIRSQYTPMRSKGAPVYFVPGNHDWDKMGANGLAKIKAQWQYLENQGDSLLKLVPPNGCPDPIEINLTNDLVIIAYDSEWWLFPFDKTNTDAECSCKTKKDVLAKFDELRYKNRNKIIMLASHHPFQSYGVHGGRYSWKDHLFPLTNLNKNLYLPMPVIGSLYPFLRNTFLNPEDLKHPLYKDMIRSIDKVFDSFPNLVHVAGHEHGLQFIKDGDKIQVVSGAGAKHSNASKGKNSLFADATQGYVTADLYTNKSVRFTYYIFVKDTIQQAFTYLLPYIQPTDVATINNATPITGDSIIISVHPSYNNPGKFHRFLFGENYRKEWAAPTKLPVIHASQFQGGLKPLQLGGGMQSHSMRLEDKTGKEWVIRSVEKSPDALLPEGLKNTFARDILDDETSGQHPFSALIVPPIANAVNVPHANPIIGVIAPDPALGNYGRSFNGTVVLLEEREPLGKSDNTGKMEKSLQKDNDNDMHAKEFLRARMLDAFLGDWDRHEDQWRWYNDSKDKNKDYVGVPRDRDQVFHVTQGLLPRLASAPYILPIIANYDPQISRVKWLMYKAAFFSNQYPAFQLSREEWKKTALNFQKAMTDSVLEASLLRLPKASYDIGHDKLLKIMQSRREHLPAAMDEYYRFSQKVVDILASDKNELIEIKDAENGGLRIRMRKINKEGKIKDELMDKTYDPVLTKEIRIYLGKGNDSVVLNNKSSKINLRIIGGKDEKAYNVIASNKKVPLYDQLNNSSFSGDTSRLRKHISSDSANTAFNRVNLYNIFMPLANIGGNADDGLILGAGFKFIKQEGFRKTPYASSQQLMVGHSFSTKAYNASYTGDWIHVIGKADIIIQAAAKAPNTQNYFGLGNETSFDKTGNYKRYYRSRFSIYHLDPAFRWRTGKGSALTIGPSLSYYVADNEDNVGRLIANPAKVGSYDSTTINKDKLHLGVSLNYLSDRRNNKILPQWGTYINFRIQAYSGVGSYTKSFAQFIPEVALYKSLDAKSNLVLAERLGGTVGIGQAAFYQSAFIGGQGNLLGYRQYRFAGKHSFYNNLELRIKLGDVASYILPGQFGITGFYDIGRVWVTNDDSGKWHNGVGGGIYFAPASLISASFVMGHSTEGWYPYFNLGLRF